MNCISCNHEHDENFCSNCGEKKNIDKITFTSMINFAFLSVANINKVFLFNLNFNTVSM